MDDVFVGRRFDLAGTYASAYAALVAAALAAAYAGSILDPAIIERLAHRVRSDLYRHLIALSPGSLRNHAVGELISRLSTDTRRVEYLIYSGPFAVAASTVGALYYAVFLAVLSLKLTLCALAVAPILALVSWRSSPRLRRMSRIARIRADAWTSLATERLGAAPVVFAFAAAPAESRRFETRSAASRDADRREAAMSARVSLGIEVIAALGGFLVLGLGAVEMYEERLTVGSLVAFLGSLGSLYAPIRSLAKASGRFQRAAVGTERVLDLLLTPPLVVERPGARVLREPRGDVSVRDVRFGHGTGADVLDGVTLQIEAGETVALVGANGSGKSTLLGLAARLWDPRSGAVLLDGVDLREITLASLRTSVAVVLQEPFLIAGSVRDNIRYGSEAATPDLVARAARAAHADGFISDLPARFGAPVGPGGRWLSGGERQRLALARAILRDAPVLLLDEATASVDGEAEDLIQDAVSRLSGRRTILMASHRLSSVLRADRVVVLENGRIIQQGPPLELARQGRFASLLSSQMDLRPIPQAPAEMRHA